MKNEIDMTGGHKEIERRFLLKRFPKLDKIDIVYDIEQWYSPDGYRYRYQVDQKNNQVTIFKERKVTLSRGVNHEETTIITNEEFEKLDLSSYSKIKKVRTVVKENDLKFEIDSYENTSLITLEVELDDIEQDIVFPESIEKEILFEVTGIKEFTNKKLAE
jgi:CYTH domain-containing protein